MSVEGHGACPNNASHHATRSLEGAGRSRIFPATLIGFRSHSLNFQKRSGSRAAIRFGKTWQNHKMVLLTNARLKKPGAPYECTLPKPGTAIHSKQPVVRLTMVIVTTTTTWRCARTNSESRLRRTFRMVAS